MKSRKQLNGIYGLPRPCAGCGKRFQKTGSAETLCKKCYKFRLSKNKKRGLMKK